MSTALKKSADNMFLRKLFGKKSNARTAHENKKEVIDSGNIRVVIRSDLGNIRMNNEDLGLFLRIADEDIAREKGCLMIVADGMGGHQSGEVASRIATQTIGQEYYKPKNAGSIETALHKSFLAANQQILQMASRDRSHYGMGTTCTALVAVGSVIYYAHVGDSRAYLIRKDKVWQITEDHTYVQELVRKGEITEKEAENHPKRNILTNAMGTKTDIRVDTGKFRMSYEPGDKLLLCSDGLYEYIKDEEMAAVLSEQELPEAAEYLIQETKRRGAHDNITVVLAEKTASDVVSPARETRDVDLPLEKEIPATKEHDLP